MPSSFGGFSSYFRTGHRLGFFFLRKKFIWTIRFVKNWLDLSVRPFRRFDVGWEVGRVKGVNWIELVTGWRSDRSDRPVRSGFWNVGLFSNKISGFKFEFRSYSCFLFFGIKLEFFLNWISRGGWDHTW